MRTRSFVTATTALIVAASVTVIGAPSQPLISTASGTQSAAAVAAVDCYSSANPIACENAKPGTPRSQWDVEGAGSPTIQGFATVMSVNVGQRIAFKVRTDARAYSIQIYRTGYYGGSGARRVATVTPSAVLPQAQPECLRQDTTGLVDCGNWNVSASWLVPGNAVSGVYVARLVRADTGAASHIIFVVRDDSRQSQIIAQTSDTTWQAYNAFGGNSFYAGPGLPLGRATKVSYNRPLIVRGAEGGRDSYFSAEYPMVQFLEANGYDVGYVSGIDVATRPGVLTGHRVFMSLGHDEYWSGTQRAAVEAARDAGVNLAFFSGNEVYWRTRWEPSIAAGAAKARTLVCYKESRSNRKIDPSAQWTGTWRDPRFDPSMVPENALTGTAYRSNTGNFAITASSPFSAFRAWRGTPVASLAPGGSVQLAPGSLGYEFDEAPDDAARPGGLVRLSSTSVDVQEYLSDYGSLVLPARATHSLTMHRARSGALVFGAGTIQWSWGLGMWHVGQRSAANRSMQQFTVNVLADMGVRAQTPLAGLVATSASTDRLGPRTAITSPVAGGTAVGPSIQVRGTAVDTGGRVASVEYSSDGGRTWRTASGRATWTATVMPRGSGPVTVLVRAVDDSYNIGASSSVTINTRCPCTIFDDFRPPILTNDDPAGTPGVEVGLRFSSATDGQVIGMRFFQGPGNDGPHVVRLWGPGRELLATTSAAAESSVGWRTVMFGAPVGIAAGREYVVSYHSPNARYAADPQVLAGGALQRPPLTALGGAYEYGPGGTFPSSSVPGVTYAVDPIVTGAG